MSIGNPTRWLYSLVGMETWARRIEERLKLGHQGPSDLARACKIKPSSISEWFGRASKTTKMISGDNLVAAAKFLGVTEEWIMTGAAPIERSVSQPERLDHERLLTSIQFLEKLFAAHHEPYVIPQELPLLAAVYDELVTASEPNMVDMTIRFGNLLGGKDGRQGKAGSTGSDDRGKVQRPAAQAKAAIRRAR